MYNLPSYQSYYGWIRPFFRRHQKFMFCLFYYILPVWCQVLSSSLKWWFGSWKQEGGQLQIQNTQMQNLSYFSQCWVHLLFDPVQREPCSKSLYTVYLTFCQISSNVSSPTLKQTIPWYSSRIKANPSVWLIVVDLCNSLFFSFLFCFFFSCIDEEGVRTGSESACVNENECMVNAMQL